MKRVQNEISLGESRSQKNIQESNYFSLTKTYKIPEFPLTEFKVFKNSYIFSVNHKKEAISIVYTQNVRRLSF